MWIFCGGWKEERRERRNGRERKEKKERSGRRDQSACVWVPLVAVSVSVSP
jgi:hypothetical protein